jgi:hypothetical protein
MIPHRVCKASKLRKSSSVAYTYSMHIPHWYKQTSIPNLSLKRFSCTGGLYYQSFIWHFSVLQLMHRSDSVTFFIGISLVFGTSPIYNWRIAVTVTLPSQMLSLILHAFMPSTMTPRDIPSVEVLALNHVLLKCFKSCSFKMFLPYEIWNTICRQIDCIFTIHDFMSPHPH